MVMNDLRGHFRPEFLNRLDEIILFKPLTKDNIGNIVDLMVAELDQRLSDQELSLTLTEAAKAQVVENGYDPVYGARPRKRYLQNYVETLAARKILSGDVHAGDTLELDVREGQFIINVKDGNRCIPKDPVILLSYVNTQLRDYYESRKHSVPAEVLKNRNW